MEFIGLVAVDGDGFMHNDEVGWRSWLKNNKGRRIVIDAKRYYKRRSLPQNDYYFGVIVDMVRNALIEEWGADVSVQEVHETLKVNCNSEELLKDDAIIGFVKSTKRLTTVEFEEYTEKCRRWAAEWLKITIPEPHQTEFTDEKS